MSCFAITCAGNLLPVLVWSYPVIYPHCWYCIFIYYGCTVLWHGFSCDMKDNATLPSSFFSLSPAVCVSVRLFILILAFIGSVFSRLKCPLPLMYCYGVVYKLAKGSLQCVALVYVTKDNPLQLTRMYIITLMCFCIFGSDLNDLEPHFFLHPAFVGSFFGEKCWVFVLKSRCFGTVAQW